MAIRDFRFDNLPRSAQLVIFAVLIVGMAFAFYTYYLKDLIQERDAIHAEIKNLELSVAQGTAIETRLKQFKQELVQLEERLAVLQSILPAEKETPAILRSIQQMASSSNLRIDRFAPQPLVPRAFYSDWPIKLEVQGNYNGLGMFFERISRATRIIDVGTISIKGIEQQKDPTQTLTASCTATTFVFRDEPSATSSEMEQKKEKKQ
jgi:type IV pilus assembly protein PilO